MYEAGGNIQFSPPFTSTPVIISVDRVNFISNTGVIH